MAARRVFGLRLSRHRDARRMQCPPPLRRGPRIPPRAQSTHAPRNHCRFRAPARERVLPPLSNPLASASSVSPATPALQSSSRPAAAISILTMNRGTAHRPVTVIRSAMPAPVLVVHNEFDTRELALIALRGAGRETAGFENPMTALDA